MVITLPEKYVEWLKKQGIESPAEMAEHAERVLINLVDSWNDLEESENHFQTKQYQNL